MTISTLVIDEFEVSIEWCVMREVNSDDAIIEYDVFAVTEYDEHDVGVVYTPCQCRQFEQRHALLIEGSLWDIYAKRCQREMQAMLDQPPTVHYDYHGPRDYVPAGEQ